MWTHVKTVLLFFRVWLNRAVKLAIRRCPKESPLGEKVVLRLYTRHQHIINTFFNMFFYSRSPDFLICTKNPHIYMDELLNREP